MQQKIYEILRFVGHVTLFFFNSDCIQSVEYKMCNAKKKKVHSRTVLVSCCLRFVDLHMVAIITAE